MRDIIDELKVFFSRSPVFDVEPLYKEMKETYKRLKLFSDPSAPRYNVQVKVPEPNLEDDLREYLKTLHTKQNEKIS